MRGAIYACQEYVRSGTILSASHLRACKTCVKSKGERERDGGSAGSASERTYGGFEFEVGCLFAVCLLSSLLRKLSKRLKGDRPAGGPLPSSRRGCSCGS